MRVRAERAGVYLGLALEVILAAGASEGAEDHGLQVAVDLVRDALLAS